MDESIEPLLNVLLDCNFHSEQDLAEKLEIEINVVRNKLYKLSDYNLIGFEKKRDEIKGWFIYYWALKPERVSELYYQLLDKRIKEIDKIIEFETSDKFFVCNDECARFNFEQASSQNFMCPECGQVLQPDDNKNKISKLEIERKIIIKKNIKKSNPTI